MLSGPRSNTERCLSYFLSRHLDRLNLIIVKSSATEPAILGALFGLHQTVCSLARGIAPSLVSVLFAFSIRHRDEALYEYGNFVWVVMVGLGLFTIWLSKKVKFGGNDL